MALPAEPSATPGVFGPRKREPMLEPGDRLSREEFERRYERMPELKKAELIEGIVYLPSPGLWLETQALLKGDMKAVLAALRKGVDSPEHSAFVRS